MTTQLEQFAQELHQEVLAKSGEGASASLREEAFTEVVLERLAEHNEADNVELCYYEGKSFGRLPACKLNGWTLSGDGATLDLFVVKYQGTAELVELGKPEVRKYFDLVQAFLKRALEGFHTRMEESSSGFQPVQRIHAAKEALTTVRLFFLTDGIIRSLDLGLEEQERFEGLDVRYVAWDLDKLSRLQVGSREAIELDFVNDYGGPVSCLQTADPTGEYRTYLAFMPAPLLARIYGEHGQRLLERNVRAFLQAKNKVNRGLQKTLKEEPHRFLAYNNGLCCTAADLKVRAGADGHALLEWVKDFQIVNGGQTTASIYHAVKKEKISVDQVMVQVKLTVLKDSSKVAEIVPLIAQYANSQNTVKPADLAANGSYHHKLENLSRTVWAPAASGLERGTRWYYERARGSYADDKARQGTPAQQREWERQNPAMQKFTKTDVAKFEQTWCGLPHLVCLGAEKNFVKFAERLEEDGDPVVDHQYFRNLVAKGILLKAAERVFTSEELEGYRANSVAYAVAWLANRSGQRIDLERIWNEQRVSDSLVEALKVVCRDAHACITSQPGNPGEASKRVSTWHHFRDRDIQAGKAWLGELATRSFSTPNSEEATLQQDWESIRSEIVDDPRTVAELESATGISWVASRRKDPIAMYTGQSWSELRGGNTGLGIKKLRGLIELVSAAVAASRRS